MSNNYVIYGLLLVGCLIILSNFLDPKWIISSMFKKKVDISKEDDFLNVIALWYKLKEQCDKCNLTVASAKLDEVFPLLNGILNDEKFA